MKTLSEAVQVSIITEAGSIYRNVLLSALKEWGVINSNHAKQATQEFLTQILDNLSGDIEHFEIDYGTLDTPTQIVEKAVRHG